MRDTPTTSDVPRSRSTALLALAALTTLAAMTAPTHAQPGDRPPTQDGGGLLARMTAFHTDVPQHPLDIVLVNPTHDSITVSVLACADTECCIELAPPPGGKPVRTPARVLKAGEPALFVLTDLRPDTDYHYRCWSRALPQNSAPAGRPPGTRATQEAEFTPTDQYSFHTPRPPGSPFTFTIIADSHLDAPMTPAVYEQALANALADSPDFHIDLGDTFMTDKRGRDFKSAQPQYLAQRYYLGQLCHSAPLFMVLGNHDGEWGYARGRAGDKDAMAPWSFNQRTRYFPAPAITDNADGNAMYSGQTTLAKGQGANYYAFTWSDAQCIVLDPFWFTNEKARGPGGRNGAGKNEAGDRRGGRQAGGAAPDAESALTDESWTMTLGQTQYDWLTRTLESSHSTHKFVFIHHLVGGLGRSSRGGAGAAGYFEWGGKNADGSDGFAAHRPGWPMPIHQLLLKHHVEAVFHGHDHLYVHEELDGITYQCVPQPGNTNAGTRSAPDYGYKSGTIAGSPGHLRVSVTPTTTKVEFVRADTNNNPESKPARQTNRSVVDAYEMHAPPGTPR
ncbi:MAG: metallophosphoesterase [Phycisphaerales bacterium]